MSRPDTTASERDAWSCDHQADRDCREPHGCHCREITAQKRRIAALEADASEIARLRETVEAQEREIKRLGDTNAQLVDALDKAGTEIHRLASETSSR